MHIDDTKEIKICVLAISSVFFQKRKITQSFLFQKKNSICTLKNKKSTQSSLFKKKKRKIQSVLFKMKKSTQSCFSKQKNLLRRTSGSLRSCPPNTLFSLSGNVHGVLVLVTPFLFLTFFSSPLLRVQSFSSIEKEFGQNAQQRFYCVKVMLVYSIAFFDNAVLKMLY